ncbi:hypothetical protein MTR67_051543 [Solanum verrucosum]|uniref:Uncharacterized protein n=1 Tax=Solanum verrucosum TaxID=315347 RepID=A0AAF1A273_SOLVR|nr:hypothetical protein MTR67_051543 [Solanum verrucosum]
MAQSRQKSYAEVRRRDLGFEVAYELEFSNELPFVHPRFHVSLLKKCVGDLTSIVPKEGLGVKENLSYEEVPVEILERKVMKLRNKEVATYEAEVDMMSRYPHLFPFIPTQS